MAPELFPAEDAHLDDLLRLMVERGGTELRLQAGRPPLVVVDGAAQPAPYPPLTSTQVCRLLDDVLTDRQVRDRGGDAGIRLAYGLPRVGRFELAYENGQLTARPA